MASESPEPIERWTAKRQVALVVSILKGETSVAETARTHGLTIRRGRRLAREVSARRGERARNRPRDEEAVKDEQIKGSNRKSGIWSSTTIFYRRPLKPLPFGPEDIRRVKSRCRVSRNDEAVGAGCQAEPACIGRP